MRHTANEVTRIERNRTLHVRRRRGWACTQEAAGGERRDREIAATGEAVAQPRSGFATPRAPRAVGREWLVAAQDDPACVVVVEPMADARHVGDYHNTHRLEERGRPDARQLQELR